MKAGGDPLNSMDSLPAYFVKGEKTMPTIKIDWKPNKNSKTPVYRQIIEYIREKVATGDWIIGSKLPSQRAMSESFGVNRSTIVTAMEELVAYGILESDFGGGTKVKSNTWSLLASQPPDWGSYIESGPFKANVDAIKTINKLEFDPTYIRIGTGELSPRLYPSKIVNKIFKKMPERILSLNYLGPLGLTELRKALSERLYLEQGIQSSLENTLIVSGSLQGLQLISVCMLQKGSLIYTEAPTYLKSVQVFQSEGMNLRGIPMDKDGIQYWNIKENSRNALLYTIPTNQNPTGTVMSKERRWELLNFCQKERLPILEDDAYGQLWLDEKPPKPIKAYDTNGTVIYMGTVSKTMAPGLRIGWVVGPEAVVERMGDVKMQTDYGASSVSQWIMTELLTGGDYDIYLANLRKELKIRRDIALKSLEKNFSQIATWNEPAGGFYIWLKFNKKISIDKLFHNALKYKVLLNPGSIYDYSESNAIRISYSYAEPEDIEKALEILAGLVDK